MLYRNNYIWTMLALILLAMSCKKLVTVDEPEGFINEENVFTSDATAAAVVTGIYTKIAKPSSTLNSPWSISIFTGLSGDELTLSSSSTNVSLNAYYRNSLSATVAGFEQYNFYYPLSFACNATIEGLAGNNKISEPVKNQLVGEAKFLRAYFYFLLTNLYGKLPMPLTTDYVANANLSSSTENEIYIQIAKDLDEAIPVLSAFYLKADAVSKYNEFEVQRVKATKWAALALKARVSLYRGNYTNAINEANQVIDNNPMYSLAGIDSVFLKNNFEAIWQIQPVNSYNADEARVFILNPTGGPTSSKPVYLSKYLMAAFEQNDLRRDHWVGISLRGADTFYFPYKYKQLVPEVEVTEYMTLLRLGEVYLIRAEAKLGSGDISGALDDLNAIRRRAGLADVDTDDAGELKSLIIHERRVELFVEYGHRWFDMKRLNLIDNIMEGITPLKTGDASWQTYKKLFPIPSTEILKNPNIEQNDNY